MHSLHKADGLNLLLFSEEILYNFSKYVRVACAVRLCF